MFIDTHCHINMMIKKSFDILINNKELLEAEPIIKKATDAGVGALINVGTSLIESANCVALTHYQNCYAAVGIHPNDATNAWQADFKEIKKRWLTDQQNILTHRIVAVGEVGLDYHYPDYNSQRQHDLFKASIELALEQDLALIVHTRDAGDATLRVLEEYKNETLRGVIHCFSEDRYFADQVIAQGFVLGIGGTLTYPKNNDLRDIFSKISLESIILETDAPFLPPQSLRGTQNHPANIPLIAQFLATLRGESLEKLGTTIRLTTQRVFRI